jgi:hypothetical protein
MPLPSRLSKEALGYQLHTNRELGMMLRREKPLAVFGDVDGAFPLLVLRYLRMFDRHVLFGTFAKREHRETIYVKGTRHDLLVYLYALPEEAWRIDAMIELRHRMSREPWTTEHERMEGMLLGYTDQQNDEWIASGYTQP